MKILVTGASGFIGERVVASLLEKESIRLTVIARKNLSTHDFATRGVQVLQGDLVDAATTLHATREIDVVIHCAGLAGTWGSYDDYDRANVLMTKHLLDASKKNNVQRFINLSSPSIYFDFKDQLNLKEDFLPAKFSNHYASTKWEAEKIVRQAHGDQLSTVSLRPRSVIGAGDRNVLPRLLKLAESGGLVQLGRGENIVDITSVENLLDAIHLCLEAPSSAMGETYNITNGEPIRFWEFVDLVIRHSELQPKPRRRLPLPPLMLLAKANEIIHRVIGSKHEPTFLPISIGVISYSMTLDISKARLKLGYKPRVSTEDAIIEFFAAKK